LKRSIIIAELCYSESILIYDSLLDNSKRLSSLQRKSIQLVANVFLVEGTSILKKIFAPNSYFWILHNHFMVEYWNVIAWEKAYCSKRRRWSDREIELLGKKLSFLKVTAAAFACLANDTTQLKIVERLLEQFHIGMQMIDDIDDWKEDISENNYTYFASQMFRISNKARRKIRHRQNTALLRTLNVSLHYIRLARGCAVKLSLSSFTEFLNIILEAVNHLTSLNKNYFRDIIEKGASTYMLINPN
jgi:hypothetical protein